MITYSEEALKYISKLSSGGLRDAITLMDKCLAYSDELTVENVITVLGTVDYKVMEDLTEAIIGHERDRLIKIIEQTHAEGKDLKRFIRDYVDFVLDVLKYDITKFDYITIPQTEQKWLDSLSDSWYESINRMLSPLIKLVDRVKYDTSPKTMIEVSLLILMEDII